MTKILIIEDRKYVLENIIKILRRKDYDVKGAHNGKIGIKIAKKYLPDLIICDILMPELDGYMVLTEVRKNPAIQLTPFIFLTALREKDYIWDMRRHLYKKSVTGEEITAGVHKVKLKSVDVFLSQLDLQWMD